MTRNRSLSIGVIALVLALTVLAGCSGKPNNVANAPVKELSAITGSSAGTVPADPGSSDAGSGVNEADSGTGGTVTPPSVQSSNNDGTEPDVNAGKNSSSGNSLETNPGTKSEAKSEPKLESTSDTKSEPKAEPKAEPKSEPKSGTDSGTKMEEGQPKIVASNEAFRIFGPAPESVVGKSFTVKGQAHVFEAAFRYSFEDGHNVLAEGHVMADKGAPEWGDFEIEITLTDPPTSPTGVLTIYESSAKDGSSIHKLHIAYTFEKGILQPIGDIAT